MRRRDRALPDVIALDRLVERVVEAGGDQCWGDMVTILATTALRISELSGLRVGDIDLVRGLLHVERHLFGSWRLGHEADQGSSAAGGADH